MKDLDPSSPASLRYCAAGDECTAPATMKGKPCPGTHKCTRCLRHIHAMCGIPEPNKSRVVDIAKMNACYRCARLDGLIPAAASPATAVAAGTLDSQESEDEGRRAASIRGTGRALRSRSRAKPSASPVVTRKPGRTAGRRAPRRAAQKKTDSAVGDDADDEADDDEVGGEGGDDDEAGGEGGDDDEAGGEGVMGGDDDGDFVAGDSESDAYDDDDDGAEYPKPYFSPRDRSKHPAGWYIPDDLEPGEDVGYRFQEVRIPPRRIVKAGTMLEIPASTWGTAEEWWKDSRYEAEFRKLTALEVSMSVVILGKVLGSPMKGYLDVALACNRKDNEVCQLRVKDIRRFVVPDSVSPPARKAARRRKTSLPSPVGDEEDNSDSLVEDEDDVEVESEEESGEELATDSGAGEATEAESDEEPHDTSTFVVWDSNGKSFRRWKKTDVVRETSFARAKNAGSVKNIAWHEWPTISATEIFKRNLPEGEMELWARLTSVGLEKAGKAPTTADEMWKFLGVLSAVSQASKKGGVEKAFETESDGLFPALDLGRFGLKFWRWKQLWQHWTFGEKPEGVAEEDLDPYWETDQLIERFNNHYTDVCFEHGYEFTIDERMFWGYMFQHSLKCVDRKPRGTGQEVKCITAQTAPITTTLEHVSTISLCCFDDCQFVHYANITFSLLLHSAGVSSLT